MSEPEPRLSVVIPSCNGERHLPACLESLSRQTMQEFEVILVENGSTDRTVEIVERDFPWVKLIRMGSRQGFSRPVNLGWRSARAEWVFLLNDDTVCDEECLAGLMAGVAAYPDADFFAALMLFHDNPDVVNSAGHQLMSNGTVVERGVHTKLAEPFTEYAKVFGACAGAALYRRSLLERLGGMDEDFWIINEDVDFDFRAQLAGANCVFLPRARVWHRLSQSMGTGSPRMVHAYTKNLVCYLIKDIPPAFWARHRLRVLGHLWKASSALVREHRFGALLRARWDLIHLGPKMLAKRRRLLPELLARGERVADLVDDTTWAPDTPEGAETVSQSAPARLWRNAAPGLVAGVLMLPVLFWLGLAALQDRWLARGLPDKGA